MDWLFALAGTLLGLVLINTLCVVFIAVPDHERRLRALEDRNSKAAGGRA